MNNMTAYETKKIIYETIVKEIYINLETAYKLTQVIYDNLQAAQQSEQAEEPVCSCGAKSFTLAAFPNHCGRCGKPFLR